MIDTSEKKNHNELYKQEEPMKSLVEANEQIYAFKQESNQLSEDLSLGRCSQALQWREYLKN